MPDVPEGEPDPLDSVIPILEDHNQFSMAANLPTTHFEFDSIHLPDYEAFEDYEPGSSYTNGYDGETCEVDEIEEKKSDTQDAVWKIDEDIEAANATLELLDDQGKSDSDEYAEWEEKIQELEKLQEEAQEIYDGWDSAERESDELMWNTAWSINGRVDVPLARSLGLDTVEFINDEKHRDTYFSLGGIGMDMSPKLAAYAIFELGFCPTEYSSHFDTASRFDYFKHVAHPEVAVNCLVKLEVLDIALHNNYFTDDEIDRYKIQDALQAMDNSDTI